MAMTLDGKVARPDGKWYGLSSREDKKKMDLIRSQYEALILGKNSIINDDPVIHLRYVSGKEPTPVLLIRKGIIPKTKKVFLHTKKKPILFCSKINEQEILSELNELADIYVLNSFEPKNILSKLNDLGFEKILLEGGPSLNDVFFKEDLIQRIHLTIVPYLIGQNSIPSIANGEKSYLDFDKKKWSLTNLEKIEDEIFLTYDL